MSIEPWNTAAGGSAACEDMPRKSVDIRPTDNPVSQKRGHCALFLPSGEDGFGQRPKTGQGTGPLWVLRATPQALRELIGIKIYRFQGSFEPIFFSLVFHRLLDTTKQELSGGMWKTARTDFAESIRFIRKEKPVIGKAVLVVCGINLFLSAMIIVALPYLITEVLNLEPSHANRLYGFAEGALAAGGLAGGIGAGIFANKLVIHKSGNLVIACAVCVFPISASLILFSSAIINYIVITVCCFAIMVFSTLFAVQMMSFIQTETPQNLIGKVIAVVLTFSMCAQPLGNAFYGILFEICKGCEYAVVLFSGVVSILIAINAKIIFQRFS